METTKTIAIYGASGHGKVVADVARAQGYETIIWIDDNATLPHAMSFAAFYHEMSGVPVALGIGVNPVREQIAQRLKEYKLQIATLIHPSAVVSPSATIEEGAVVMPGAIINADTVIGEGSIVNSGAVIEHDCSIGEFCHISPNASLAGKIQVGMMTHIGIGASVIQQRSIGAWSIIGAGSVVILDIPSYVMAAGVPAIVKKSLS